MKKTSSALCLLSALLLTSAIAFSADETTESTDSKLPIEEYNGQKLDIKKVESITHERGGSELDPCEVVPTEMIYMDSKGKEHDLEFEEKAGDCSANN